MVVADEAERPAGREVRRVRSLAHRGRVGGAGATEEVHDDHCAWVVGAVGIGVMIEVSSLSVYVHRVQGVGFRL